MKRILVAVAVIIFILVVGVVGRNSSGTEKISTGGEPRVEQGETVDIDSVLESDDSVLLDVRTPEEYNEAHFEGAMLLPLQDIESGEQLSVDKTKTIYLYCRSGNRSAQATRLLQAQDYEVVDLGGIDDVLALGGKLTPGDCSVGDLVCMNDVVGG
jgi:phage shock protein E